MDHFSPVAPAHIRVLVLPVGQIERQRFQHFLHRLHAEASIIPLADVPQNSDSDAFFLSPTTFPRGSLLYRFSSAAPSDQQLHLSPFELFREPLLVVGVVDGLHKTEETSRKEQLESAAAYLKERHPRVVHRQLVVLEHSEHNNTSQPSIEIGVTNPDKSDDPSLRAALREVSARFLIELTTYARATQASPAIATPGQTARSLQRTTSLREDERRPGSGRSTPPNAPAPSTPTDEGSPARRPPSMPATSFDQIPGINSPPSSNSRPESRSSNKGKSGRSSSQDRVSVQGFGSSTSQEKLRIRGRARVGIVLAEIYMMAGHWTKALSMFVEHTSKVRTLLDHLWHAKGLENMLACMLLLAWSGVDFQMPSICEPVMDRTGPIHAARIAAETKAAAEGTKQQLQLFRLSVAIPDLSKLILSLYRSGEGSLELPFLAIAEASVRMSRCLAVLGSAGGRLTAEAVRPIVVPQTENDSKETALMTPSSPGTAFGKAKLSKVAVADMLAQALPTPDENVPTGDHIRILAGVASTYALVGLDRKKAMTVKDLVVRLTGALIQARKLGAAEMGIHPAASLSTDTGADTLLALAEESKGINDLMADICKTYGATLIPSSRIETPSYVGTRAFGNSSLKFDLLRELAGFCEASPDPYGVLLLTASLLRAAGPNAAIDAAPAVATNAFSREEQMHLATVIHRTVAVSKHLGLTDVRAVYWDPFLVRGLEILQPSGHKAVIDRTKIAASETPLGQPGPGNPLLYDPNASRPGTAAKQTFLLVQNEPSECIITLQNPFDIPVDIEDMALVTDGVELLSKHEPVTLGPLRYQQVLLVVHPTSVGLTRINGCRIRMQGCRPQVFPIIADAWSAKAPLTVKDLGLDARPVYSDADAAYDIKSLGVEPEILSASVIDALPTLVLEANPILEAGLMLLEGERRSLDLVVRNCGSTPASVFEIQDSGGVLHLRSAGSKDIPDDAAPDAALLGIGIEPGDKLSFCFELEGKAGVSQTQVSFYYCTRESGGAKYARVVSVPINMTVNAALQVHNLEVSRKESKGEDALLLSFDLRNAWPKSIAWECGERYDDDSGDLPKQRGSLAPGEIRRLHMIMLALAPGAQYEEKAEVAKSKFLARLQVLWEGDGRRGVVDLQNLSLSPESMSCVRGAPVAVSAVIVGQKQDKEEEYDICAVGAFIRIRIRIVGLGARKNGPLSVALSTAAPAAVGEERRMAVVGTLHRVLPALAEGEETVVEFVICPLLAGLMELEVVVQPAAGTNGEEGVWLARRSLAVDVGRT